MAPPTSYKPIQPAPAKRERSGDGSVGTRSVSGSVLSSMASERPTKRLKAVTQACHTCRRFKARCDGARPRCGGCAAKGKPCGYEGEEGQSRQAAMKSRLEALEKLMGALQSKSPEEAEELLQRIRSADDILSLSGSAADGEASCAAARSIASGSSGSSRGASGTHRTTTTSRLSSNASDSSGPTSTSQDTGSSQTLVTSISALGSPHNRLGADSQAFLFGFFLPSAQSTWAGVQSFYSSSGKLFHVFSESQVQDYHKSVYGFDGKPNRSQKVAICCLCIVAAIGVQYNPGDFEKGSDGALYEVAHHLFASVVEESPLEAIKVCTLLAMFNVMNKATVALAYVETGLTMSKRQSQGTGVCHPSSLTEKQWVDFRQVWRTLIFFSSWLSSTLGYISGSGDSTFEKLVPLAKPDFDNFNEIEQMVQAEMTKISLLKAGILKTHLAKKELTSSSMKGIMKELQEWHERLPDQMQLNKLGDFNLAPGIRWSIYHIHLLNLGAYMLVYRRIAAQYVREFRDGNAITHKDPTAVSFIDQGVTAARDSARILGLLHHDKGIFRRCWLVIFQTHTSCVVLLHAVAQKQLHNFPASSWEDDMKQARNCLDVLGFCAESDPVALRFRIKLSGIYEALSDSGARRGTSRQRVEEWVLDGAVPSKPSADYLLTVPSNADSELLKLSGSLLYALCRPWGDVGNLDKAELATCDTNESQDKGELACVPAANPLSNGRAQLDWEFNKHNPFRWDTAPLGVHKTEQCVFLGSDAPSGWSPAGDIEETDADYPADFAVSSGV